MERTAEIPDTHVADLAQQFLDTAVLLCKHLPAVVAPSALCVNAAFAIELFLKSLNSTWVLQEIDQGIGCFEVTTESNSRGHNLKDLFLRLPHPLRSELNNAFMTSTLFSKFKSLEEVLDLYACAFVDDRYGFERRVIDTEQRRPGEIVVLAEFFGEFVRGKPRIRFTVPSQSPE